jgi:multiple sugar transport system permease protein
VLQLIYKYAFVYFNYGAACAGSRASRRGKAVCWTASSCVALLFVAVFLFPMFWGVPGGLRSVQDLGRNNPTFLPQKFEFSNYWKAWSQLQLGMYFKNTLIQVGEAWVFAIVVLTLAGFALSRIKPSFGNLIMGAILASLWLPSYALVVPKYLIAQSLPFTRAFSTARSASGSRRRQCVQPLPVEALFPPVPR